MATDRVSRAVLEFVTDSSKFFTDIDKAKREAGSLRKSFDDVSKGLTSFGQGATRVGIGMTAGITAPLLAAGIAGAKFAADLNAGMANVATLIPKSTARVKELKGSVQEMAVAVGKSTSDLTDGLYQVISAFGDGADTVKILETNAKAAAAGLATTTDAINLTSAVTKAYGDTSAASVQKVSDLALTTVRLGQTTFPELAASIGRVTPLAASLGISMESLFGVMATGTGVTGGAAEVSTQLRGVLQSLMAPTADMTKLFGELGVSSGKALLEQKGLQGTIELITQAAEKSGQPLQKFISSIEGQTLAMALAGPQAETLTQKLAAMENVAGATDEAFKEQTEGVNKLGFAWNKFKAQLEVIAQRFGDALAPALEVAANGMGILMPLVDSLLKAFAAMPAPLKLGAVGLAVLVAAAGPLLIVLGQISIGLGSMIGMMGKASGASTVLAARLPVLAGAIRALNAALMGPAGLIALLGGAAIAFTAWETAKLRAKTQEITDNIAVMKEASKLIGETVGDIEEAQKIIEAFATGKTGAALKDMEGATLRVAQAWKLGAETAREAGTSTAITNDQIGATSITLEGFGKAAMAAIPPIDRLRAEKEALAAADQKYREELAKGGEALKFAIQHMDRNGKSAKELAAQYEISEQTIARFKSSLDASVKASDKAEKAADALAKKLEKQRDALQKLGVVTATTVNEALDEFQELVTHATAAGVPFDAVIRALGPHLTELKHAADASGVSVERLDDRLREATLAGKTLLDELARAGTPAVVTGLTVLPGKVLDLTKVMNLGAIQAQNTTESFQFFGIQTRSQLQATARAAEAHFKTVSESGEATAEEIAVAAQQMADAMEAAAESTERDWHEALTGIADVLQSLGRAFDNVFGQILQGAADVVKGIDNIATATTNLGKVSAAVDLGVSIGKMLRPLLGLNRGLLGQILGTNNQGRNDVEAYAATFAGGFGEIQRRLEALGPAGQRLWRQLTQLNNAWDTEEAAAAIRAVEQAFADAETRTATFNTTVGGLLNGIKALGGGLPDSLRTYLEELERGGELTQENIDLLHELAGEGTADWEKIQEAVQRYGGDISKLGGTFQAQRMHESWQQVIDDIDLFERGGIAAHDILDLTQDKIIELAQESIRFGTEIPENMRPWIEQLIASGELVDENGEKITDIGKLTFGETLQTSLQNLTDTLKLLIDEFKKVPGAVAGIPKNVDTTVTVRRKTIFETEGAEPSGTTQPSFDEEASPGSTGGYVTPTGIQYLKSGGFLQSLFRPRGTDTVPAMLTPGEGVLNLNAMNLIGRAGLNALNTGRITMPESTSNTKEPRSFSVDVGGVSVSVQNAQGMSAKELAEDLAIEITKKIEEGGIIRTLWQRQVGAMVGEMG